MNNNFFEVLRSGINTTYQDDGRFHMQHLGVAPSGCMDTKSHLIANKILSNQNNEGVLEFAYQGPLLKLAQGKTKFTITGNVIFQIIKSNSEVINGECNRSYDLDEKDQLDILATKDSVYGYLAVEGGFAITPFCNSVSTLSRANIGPNNGKKINVKDKVFFKKDRQQKNNFLINILSKKNNVIRVLRGPQFNYFSKTAQEEFFSREYKITNLTDRMGMRLEGKVLENIVSTNIRSEGITKGAIQVPADGQPIILLTDYPTIGGYPKIANVISADYDLLIQKIPGTNIKFKCIELKEAEEAFKTYYDNISKDLNNISLLK